MRRASETEKLQPVATDEPLDLEAVRRFLRGRMEDPPEHLIAQRFGGGSSNLTYLLSDGRREWVLRRPPTGPLLPTAHDMAREFRVLSALAQTDVPVARPVALCTDNSVLDAPFYIMERRCGFIVRDHVPPEVGESVERRRAVSFAMIDAMVKLHAVNWRAVGLAEGFGKPEGYLARQLRRWHEQWERSKTSELVAIDRLEEWLARRLPTSPPATIVHGDFRLENCMINPDSLEVVAIFDWEMSTLGDPLADLGWALAHWPEPKDSATWRQALASISCQPGFPTRAELVARYEERSQRAVPDVLFYQVLALYKLTIIAQGIYRRVTGGQIRLERAREVGEGVAVIAEAGRVLAGV